MSDLAGRRALITGIGGQDGSILAEQLLEKGYVVHGVIRRQSTPNFRNIEAIHDRLVLHSGDLTDQTSLDAAVRESAPDEVYSLGAMSHVGVSFQQPVLTAEVTGLGPVRIFEAVRRFADKARVYQAGSSEMYGAPKGSPQNELTPFAPVSPYGISKLYAFWAAHTYRQAYGLFIANGILFNHEAPLRRGPEFVTRRIAMGVARIKRHGGTLTLGNLHAKRDWGYAPEYTDMMWRMLQHATPLDLVGATGETHTVQEFVTAACAEAGIPEVAIVVNDDLKRPAEVPALLGDASKARELLGWTPKVRFRELVHLMVQAELAADAGTA